MNIGLSECGLESTSGPFREGPLERVRGWDAPWGAAACQAG